MLGYAVEHLDGFLYTPTAGTHCLVDALSGAGCLLRWGLHRVFNIPNPSGGTAEPTRTPVGVGRDVGCFPFYKVRATIFPSVVPAFPLLETVLYKTQGIVLGRIKYGETSLIVNVLTEVLGLRSYLVKGARSPKSRCPAGLFQALTRLDMVVYERSSASLQYIREVKRVAPPTPSLHEAQTAARAVFLAEFLSKVLRSGNDDASVFAFVWQEVSQVYASQMEQSWFPLEFLFGLSRCLGFGTHSPQKLLEQFRQAGIYVADLVRAQRMLDVVLCVSSQTRVLRSEYNDVWRTFTEATINFYSLQLEKSLNIRSLPMLYAACEKA